MNTRSVSYQLLKNYIITILLTTLLFICGIVVIAKINKLNDKDGLYEVFSAEKIMQDDYTRIDTSMIEQLGGGLQVISSNYEVLYSKGNQIFDKEKIDPGEFANYLVHTEVKNDIVNIAYNDQKQFWLIISIPIPIKINFNIDFHVESSKGYKDCKVLGMIICGYFISLLLSIFVYSRITSRFFITPLKKICMSVNLFQEGDYSERTELQGSREFIELQTSFNAMANKIQMEVKEKELSEENRKKLMRDISHDLKNPLMSVIGYSEMILDETDLNVIEQYANIILSNSLRADELIKDLFELSQMETPKFQLQCQKADFTEYFRNEIIRMMPELEKSGLRVDIEIPDMQLIYEFDPQRMRRVISNILFNAISYCGGHGEMKIQMKLDKKTIKIIFANTVNQREEQIDVVKEASNQYYHVGLGLSIVKRIVCLHGGTVSINEKTDRSFEIQINLPILK